MILCLDRLVQGTKESVNTDELAAIRVFESLSEEEELHKFMQKLFCLKFKLNWRTTLA